MALDKQKILSDLGSVMDQLQSADCGCMGKLFNQGQGQGMGSPCYGGGCCRRGCGHPCSGEPYTMEQGMPAHGRPCMSYCNPKQLYADGYNFLNQNVMQPVVQEVYEDLRSLNSGNTVTNNPLGAKMGLTPGVPTVPGVYEGNMNATMRNMNANPGGQNMGYGGQQMAGGQQMGGGMSGNAGSTNFNNMFPGIVKGEGGALGFNPMEIAMQMNPALGKQNAGKESTQNPMSGSGGMNQNAANFASNQQAPGYQAQPNSPDQAIANQQYYQNNQAAYAASTGNQLPSNFPPQGNMNQNAQMGRMNANQGQVGKYGNHTAGVTKFKEMFPGVMQGMEGNISFDPMEIAIQMNPANKQMAAMNSMQKLMSGKPLEPNSAAMKPVINGMNAVNANFAPNQAQPTTPDQATNQITPEQQQYATNQVVPEQQYAANQIAPTQQQYAANQIAPPQQQQYATNQIAPTQQQYATNPAPSANQPIQMQQPQQVYTAVTDNQRMPQQQPTDVIATPEMPKSEGYPNQAPSGAQVYNNEYLKEPIFPADNSRYNTIGQPIHLLPARTFHSAPPSLPQTLSPQPVPSKLRNNVKSTISKTSLFAKQAGQPGRTPSRAQMQQVYNQYKGSQSYTNQNIQNIRQPIQGQTASAGQLKAAPRVEQRQIPVEKVGGDTVGNNQAYNEPVKGGHVVGQVGDVVTNNNTPPGGTDKQDMSPMKSANLRNGLQDMVYTAYPQSAAWSFHGCRDTQPFYRQRLRA